MKTKLGFLAMTLGAVALGVACSGDDSEGSGSASGGSAGTGAAGSGGTGAAGSGGAAGSAGTGTAGTAGSTGGGAGVGGGGAAGSAGADAAAGTGGGAGAPGDAGFDSPWPTCDMQPSSAAVKTIPEIWTDDPSSPTEVWVAGVYVTAISGNGCTAGTPCQIYVQDAETYASWAAGAQHGIKVRISGSTAQHFTSVQVGDQIDVLGHAWRFNLGGTNELLIQVRSVLRGCARSVGTGNPTPITGVSLTDLTVNAYENTHGPLLIQLANVSGNPAGASEIFGIWETGVGIGDAAPEDLVSISPFFLQGGSFSGLTGGATVDFQTVTGVFGLFVPFTDAAPAPKFKVIYPRAMSDLVR